MMLSDADLVSIQERASTLSERFSGAFQSQGDGNDPAASRRLARWKQVVAGDDPAKFRRILCLQGISATSDADLLCRLGAVRLPDDTVLPSWATILREIVEYVSAAFASRSDKCGRPECRGRQHLGQTPYGSLFWPITQFAREQVEGAEQRPLGLIHEDGWHALQKYLAHRLAAVASAPLQVAFLAHKAIRTSGAVHHFFAQRSPVPAAGSDSRLFESFVNEQGQQGIRLFFLRYPVVARLVSLVTLQWIGFVREFLQRFERDSILLGKSFNEGMPLGGIVGVKAGISDPHHEGRSILILRFRCGTRLVYKSRPMAVDAAFFDLVQTLNDAEQTPEQRVLKVVDRGDFGWMEFARHAPCKDKRAANRFYQRAGALASLIHWLEGVDCHWENLVAAGEHPTLIDLETLAHPLRTGEPLSNGNNGRQFWALATSALRTGLLPFWQLRFDQKSLYDNSGFGAPVQQRSLSPVTCWRHVNTDRMEMTTRVRRLTRSSHRPRLNGHPLSIRGFERDVLTGYEEMSRLLESPPDVRALQLHASIHRAPRRRIKKPTLIYGIVMRRSLETIYLHEGVERSIELQALPQETEHDAEWLAEIQSLEILDIPYFQTLLGTNDQVSIRSTAMPISLENQREVIALSIAGKLLVTDGRIEQTGGRRSGPKAEPQVPLK